MDNICNCHDCERSYRNCIYNLDLMRFQKDIDVYCSTCVEPSCLNHDVQKFLKSNYPNNNFTKETLLDPEKFPKWLRAGICNYYWEKNCIE